MADMADRTLIRMVMLVAFKVITMPHDELRTHQEVTMMAGIERPHGTVLMGHSIIVHHHYILLADICYMFIYGVRSM